MTDNVIVGHAGCGVNALSGLQILKHSISCNACCRYCYGLQVFPGPVSRIAGMPDTAPSGAVFFIPS
ncbi:hypothetical protein, partial [Escherichia coli]|uniref:hypothetical protein n=1 Tax=Escherichia coli TaxID=562 RepID=UPI001BFDC3B6